MARLRVPDQALRNFLSILLGFAIGGFNNLVVLPWAFGDNLEAWGLVRIAAAWATVLGPILAFGAPAAMNRFQGKLNTMGALPQLHATLIWPPVALFLAFVAIPALLLPQGVADLLGLEGTNREAVWPIALLSGLYTAQIYFAGYLSSRLKTALATFARETFFKFGYLALALALGMGWMGIPAFLPAFVGLYVCVLVLLFAQSMANQFRLNTRPIQDKQLLREIRVYSGTLILGSGAGIILGQIDIIMVGRLLDLSQVPIYTIAAFIATIAGIPVRAFQRLLQPLIARALHAKDNAETWRLVKLSHRSMLLTSGWIITCIAVSTPEIDRLLPAAFQGLGAVIMVIGAFKVIQAASMGSMILIGQSDHYKKTIWLQWLSVVLAIPLNFLFIPKSGLDMGLLGAALATFIAMGLAILIRQFLVWFIWKEWVLNRHSLAILVVLVVPGLLLIGMDMECHPMLLLTLKSSMTTIWVAGAAWTLNLVPEGKKLVLEKWNGFARRKNR